MTSPGILLSHTFEAMLKKSVIVKRSVLDHTVASVNGNLFPKIILIITIHQQHHQIKPYMQALHLNHIGDTFIQNSVYV